jgi:hypothetical protein
VYILLIHRAPATWDALTAEQRGAVAREHDAFQRSVAELVFTEAFADPAEAVMVRVRDGKADVIAPPYAAPRVDLRGYYLIDCSRRDRAIALAARVPDARYAAVEVRELTHQFGTRFPDDLSSLRARRRVRHAYRVPGDAG